MRPIFLARAARVRYTARRLFADAMPVLIVLGAAVAFGVLLAYEVTS